MARMNWNSSPYDGNIGVGTHGGPMMRNSVRQTEGERLHDQARSFYAHGNVAQAEYLLNKAIALEPLNGSFRETMNSWSRSMWSHSHGPPHSRSQSHQHVASMGMGFADTGAHRRQFMGKAAPSAAGLHMPRTTWDCRAMERGARPANVFPRAPWPSAANGAAAQFFSSTVADSMFGPGYPPEAVPNVGPLDAGRFADQRPDAHPARIGRSAGGVAATVPGNIWGEWNDSGVGEETLWQASGYQQSDVPWTEEEPRAAAANAAATAPVPLLPNCSRSSAASQGSFRGSGANSAVAADLASRAGWSAEETCSETGYAADDYEDVSNKVQEWLVRNQSSGAARPPPPPGFARIKKKRKKKRQQQPERPAAAQDHSAPSSSDGCPPSNSDTSATSRPFFDPKRIFLQPNSSSRDAKIALATERDLYSPPKEQSFTQVPLCADPSSSTQQVPSLGKNAWKSPIVKAHGSHSNDRTNPNGSCSDRSPDSPVKVARSKTDEAMKQESLSSWTGGSTRMTREGATRISSKPLGHPPSALSSHHETDPASFGVKANSSPANDPSAIYRDGSGPLPSTAAAVTETLSNPAGVKSQAWEDQMEWSRQQVVDVREMLRSGALRSGPPVCLACTAATTTPPATAGSSGGLPGTTNSTPTRQAFQTTPEPASAKDSRPSDDGQTVAPAETSQVERSAPPGKAATDPEKAESPGQEKQQAPRAKTLQEKPAKVFWEPARIFGGKEPSKGDLAPGGKKRSQGTPKMESRAPPDLPSPATTKESSRKTPRLKAESPAASSPRDQQQEKALPATGASNCSQKPKGSGTVPEASGDKASNSSLNCEPARTKAVPSSPSRVHSSAAGKEREAINHRGSPSDRTAGPASAGPEGSLPRDKPGDSPQPSPARSEKSRPRCPATSPAPSARLRSDEKYPKPSPGGNRAQGRGGSDCTGIPDRDAPPRTERGPARAAPAAEKPQRKPEAQSSASPWGRGRPEDAKTDPPWAPARDCQSSQPKREKAGAPRTSPPEKPSTYQPTSRAFKSASAGKSQPAAAGSANKTHSTGASASTARGETSAGPRQRTKNREASAETSAAAEDEINIEDVDPWYKWMRAIGSGVWWAICFVVFLVLILIAFMYSTIKVGAVFCWHVLSKLLEILQEHRRRKRIPGEGASRGQGSWGSPRGPPMPQTESIDIPTSGAAAIRRLLRCNRDNPYEVLGVGSEASAEDIKKYYRKQCMLVHPDKTDLANAQEAFQLLQRAYDTLTDPVKKRDFEMESRHAHFSEEMEEIRKKMEEALNMLNCDVCHGKHRRYETDRSPELARFCRLHHNHHPAYEGDVWVETSHLGFKWHYFAMMDGRIYNITDWAACQDMKHMEANSCEVRYHVGTRSGCNTSRQRSQAPPGHAHPNHHHHHSHHSHREQDFSADMTEELFKEFLRQFQQGEARGGVPRGGCAGGDASAPSQDKGRRNKRHRKKKR